MIDREAIVHLRSLKHHCRQYSASHPFDNITWDIITPLRVSEPGNRYTIVTDVFTKPGHSCHHTYQILVVETVHG